MLFQNWNWLFRFIIIALEEETIWTKQQLYQVSNNGILSIDTEQWINAGKVQYAQSANPGFQTRLM